MKSATRFFFFIFLLGGLILPAQAQITFSGDARFRPRLDIDNRPESNYELSRLYYMYRIRLNMTADIGEGYFLRSRLAHNGVGYYARGVASGERPEVLGDIEGENNTISDEHAARPELDLMYLYLGRATETAGFSLGLIPVPGFSNPMWDLHYYPNLMIDVPYFIFSTDGGFGGYGYVDAGAGRLSAYVLLDRANGRIQNFDNADDIDARDQYTFAASYALALGDLTVEPMVIKTLLAPDERPRPVLDADGNPVLDPDGDPVLATTTERFNAPWTFGGTVTLPALGGLTPSVTGGYSINNIESSDAPTTEYDAWLVRGKLSGDAGPGSVLAFADYGRLNEEGAPDTQFFYLWLNYAFTLYSSDRGSFSIGPEYRLSIKSGEPADLSSSDFLLDRRRHKIELNIDITFR